jgi:hypothetical protein
MTGTLHELEANISANLGVCNASKVAFIHVTKQLALEASRWQKSSSAGPQPRQSGDATLSRHRRAARASPPPRTG